MEKPPLLDFDPDPRGVIQPDERFRAGALPKRAVLSYFIEPVLGAVEREKAPVLATLQTFGLRQPVYGLERGGESVALFYMGVGAPVGAGFLEELIALGADRFTVCGGAGVLDSSITQGHLLLPSAAVREEGVSYHYLPPDAEARPGARVLAALENVLRARKVPYLSGKTWTTDAVYRETRAKIEKRKAEGCLSVEMEAAALFAVAEFRQVQLAQLLYAGYDVSGGEWDQRGWDLNMGVREMMLELCLEAVQRI
jgi:uridine phosphorylase